MLDGPGRRLAVHEVAVHERVLQDGRHRVDVVLAHLADVLEHEAQALEHAVLDVQLRHPVLVHQRRQHGEGTARLRDDGNGHGGADTQLALLHLQVVQQGAEHVVRPDRLRDVAEGVHGGAADRLLVRLQELQEVEADAVPLARRGQLRASVRDTPDQVDAVLLHLLVAILQDWGQPGQQVLDGRRHLGHADDVDDGLHRTQDGSEHLGILFTQVLVEEETQVTHHLFLAALLHDHRDAGDQVGRLLPNPRGGRVQPPPDDTRDLRQVGLHSATQGVHHGAKAVKHDRGVVGGLLLERVDDAVDDLLLKARVDVRHAEVGDDLVDGLHDHLSVRLRGVLQVLDDPPDDVGASDLVGNLHGGVHQLPVVAAVEGHAHDPEVPEEGRQDVFADVARLDAFRRDALLHDLQDDLLHFFVRRRELADQDDHDLSGVVVRVLGVHQGNDVSDRLQEGGQALAAVLADALPQGPQHRVEGLNAVGRGGLRQSGQRQRRDGPDLLLLVLEAVGDDVHHLLQVRQHGAAHKDGDLLHDLDPRVPGLPALLRLADGPEEEEERGDAERRGDHGEGARRGVAHVLVGVVDVRAHGGDHRGQARGLRQVADDLSALHAREVVLVDEQRLDNHEDLVDVRPHHVVELVEHAVDDLHQQVALLVFQGAAHQQGQDLVEERPGAEGPRAVRQLPQGGAPHGRRAVFDLEQQPHDLPLLGLLGREVVVVVAREERREVGVVLRLDHRQLSNRWRGRHLVRLRGVGALHAEEGRAAWGRRRRGHDSLADGLVVRRRPHDLVAGEGEDRVELLVRHGGVALVDLRVVAVGLDLLGRHGREVGREAHGRGHAGHAGGAQRRLPGREHGDAAAEGRGAGRGARRGARAGRGVHGRRAGRYVCGRGVHRGRGVRAGLGLDGRLVPARALLLATPRDRGLTPLARRGRLHVLVLAPGRVVPLALALVVVLV
mmetsp:Transcript_48257/g.149019  ORF Transcript_48257/g.149019 Transcript_48257/m.149019 type:complete len:950 (-) Transcript_48257:252-3101(-)